MKSPLTAQIFFICFLFALPAFSMSWFAKEKFIFDQVKVEKQNGEALLFQVEVAHTPELRQQGLMYRTELGVDEGMLFIFDDVARREFWMKNTYLPLDIIFLDNIGVIHHIHHMATPQSEALITAEMPARAVLEINGGLSSKLGITIGDRVLHPVFNNIYE